MSKFDEGNREVTVYNELGQIVYSTQTLESNLQINMSQANGGMYFVEVKSGNLRDVANIIVTNK